MARVWRHAFNKGGAPYPSNVTIRGLKITGYTPPMQSGTIQAGGYSTAEGTTGWVIDGNEISYNGEYGIRIGNSGRIVNNNVHHNKRLNIAGSANNTVIEGNEIAYRQLPERLQHEFRGGWHQVHLHRRARSAQQLRARQRGRRVLDGREQHQHHHRKQPGRSERQRRNRRSRSATRRRSGTTRSRTTAGTTR